MFRVLEGYLRTLIRYGDLTIRSPGGGETRFGDGKGPPVTVAIKDRGAILALARNPVIAFGDLYMDGRIEVVSGTLFEFVSIASRNLLESGEMDWTRILDRIRARTGYLRTAIGAVKSRENVKRHYDLDGRLYRLFLDPDLQYSCAYFEDRGDELAVAQFAKKRHIAAKLLIETGQRVLDIGCGWGGLALYLARFTGATVEGITLSTEQLAVARRRALDEGLADAAHFELRDYREVSERYDRIVSVGMLEHVGLKAYETFFLRVRDMLADDGVALVHVIGRALGPAPTNEWMLKHIFPGGYIPALSELMPSIERAGLFVSDIEVLRLHYAETIRAWRANFDRNRDAARALYDERFCRMWDLYLCGAENAFRIEKQVVFQLQLCKAVDAVPLTRAYMRDREEALRAVDTVRAPVRAAGE